MAGRKPYEEIDITFTGIRPGEKLAEELFVETEARTLRKVDKILLCRPDGCDWEWFDERLEHLKKAMEGCRREEIIDLFREIIPTYQPGPAGVMAPDLISSGPGS